MVNAETIPNGHDSRYSIKISLLRHVTDSAALIGISHG